ncbi:MAG: insulinase family protein [Chloroflexi bacterium]|nr:insulinase family protein [Chloroflexota bacterium]MCL5273657.1 insulinase family protein [Chloroflexota bacterium]
MPKTTQPVALRVARQDGITKAILPNGMTLVLRESHAAPVTSFWVWYRVGSRNEHLGITGVSHWVEHMLFKGTPTYTESELDRLISRAGGVRNGMTWVDWTTYYETMPSNQIDLALRIEADRMAHSLVDPKEVQSERTVIINERQGSENSPGFRLMEEVQAAAFKVHPYGHEVVGHMSDLTSMTRADLYSHYRAYYAPNNAIAAIAGDFDTDEVLQKLARLYGRLKPVESIPAVTAVEPPQRGERRVTVKGEGNTDYLLMAFHASPTVHKDALQRHSASRARRAAPIPAHEDFFPLVALDSVLCGASGLSFFGGGASNRSSRLSKALVDTGLAADISGGITPTIDPYLYSFFATAQQGKDINEVEAALWAELERVKEHSVTQTELGKALKQTRAQFAFGSESVTSQALWLGYCEIFADYTWFTSYLDKLSAVTVDDVKRVADRYLSRDNVTVGHYRGQG